MRFSIPISTSAVLCWCAGIALATWVESHELPALLAGGKTGLTGAEVQPDSGLMETVMGESRKLLASQFFAQADVYFHSGYYPSIFDAQPAREDHNHLAAETHADKDNNPAATPAGPGGGQPSGAGHGPEDDHGHDHGSGHEGEHERVAGPTENPVEYGFLGPARDPLERFGRHFFPSRHAHLEEGIEEREILPWLRMTTALDPSRVEAFTTAAFWLRTRLQRVDAAEGLLREGWRANPRSPEILFELGRLLYENRQDAARARNLWEAALRHWHAAHDGKPDVDTFLCQELLANLAYLEDRCGDHKAARRWLEELLPITPHPEIIRKRLRDLDAASAPKA